ncbi:MAG: hypothetical protein ACYDHP_06140 [Ferrimicrobium sp.]
MLSLEQGLAIEQGLIESKGLSIPKRSGPSTVDLRRRNTATLVVCQPITTRAFL